MPDETSDIRIIREAIQNEIADHENWCHPKCRTFLPDSYRQARFEGLSAKEVQHDYDGCHAFR